MNEDDDEEMKFMIRSSQSSFSTEDFILFKDDESKNENAKYAKYAKHVLHADFNI
jgi:hypothetical protein